MNSSDCETPASSPMTPCEIYAGLRDGYLALISGGNRVRVRMGERESWFGRGDIAAIRAETERWEKACLATDPATAAQLGAGVVGAVAPRFGSVTVSGLRDYRRRILP